MSAYSRLKNWRANTKEMLVLAMGSRCIICGYDKCIQALEFHHLIPSEKNFSFGHALSRPRNWNVLENELKKCIMVCSNCHSEIEDGLIETSTMSSSYDESSLLKETEKYGIKKCNECSVLYRAANRNQEFCSKLCKKEWNKNHRKSRSKIIWPKIDFLKQMIAEYGYSELGRQLGVTGNAIKLHILRKEGKVK